MIDYKDLGMRIQKHRKQKGLTQQQLAELIGAATSNISHIERGTNKVSLPSLVKIADALNVTLDQLLCLSLSNTENVLKSDLAELVKDCTKTEINSIINIISAFKEAIGK